MKAKKSLGQNFLMSTAVARRLVDAAKIKNTDVVVEVGPGRGMITRFLVEKAKRVIAVEKDARMIEHLKKKFADEILNGNLKLVHADILKFNPSDWKLEIGNWKLIGGIPYYITGAFLRRFLSIKTQPKTIALIVQKEVALRICSRQAERIAARDGKPLDSARGKESLLSLSVKAYGTPRYITTVKAGNFYPKPGVNSAIVTIENISKNFFRKTRTHADLTQTDADKDKRRQTQMDADEIDEEKFFGLLKVGFSSKRKKLIGNLKKHFPEKNLREVFGSLALSENARAEDLALEQWRMLYRKIYLD